MTRVHNLADGDTHIAAHTLVCTEKIRMHLDTLKTINTDKTTRAHTFDNINHMPDPEHDLAHGRTQDHEQNTAQEQHKRS